MNEDFWPWRTDLDSLASFSFFFFFEGKHIFHLASLMTPKWLDKRGPIKTLESVWIPLILLKTENQEYCSKIIFKCVNNTVRPIFNENFVEKRGLWVPWSVYRTYWNSHHTHKTLQKKKKKRKCRTQTGT